MKKLLLISVSILISLLSYSQKAWNNTNWGMSKNDIIELYKNDSIHIDKNDSLLLIIDNYNISNKNYTVKFILNNTGKLRKVILSTNVNKYNFEDVFSDLEYMLTSKYGNPLYKNQNNHIVKWKTSDNNIELNYILLEAGGRIFHQSVAIIYTDVNLEDTSKF